ncbi:hypothetical protein CHS0354_022814 [Potamilus streckersoni]|uniref:BZIP domain-containing protein n=1 Tax=Potamilus streckersoni TaxID=2493646 RepID=A0AAE0S1R3_9BIVA|nr:hypothetical protein CHS0354_022814 [Potamilus streckersoni]
MTLYMDSGIDSRASGASTLPLIFHEFPICSGINTNDHSLSLAMVKAIERNDMEPMIKHELKNRINFKRMAEGKEELMVDFSEKPKAELTTEEKMKVERRREQNRMAARRFREKHNTLGIKLQKVSYCIKKIIDWEKSKNF